MTRTLFGMVLVLAHAATTFAGVAVLDSTGSAVGATVTVELALSIESDLSPRAVELMRAEIDRIWQPYSVVIGWDAAGPDGSPERLRLTIADSELDRPQQSAAHAALAWIWFDTPARAGTEIRVSVDAARRLVSGVRVGGRSVAAWPALGETLLGRALGRSVAHEVGHYLLASSRHTDDGLMRPIFVPDDLLTFRARDYALAPADVRVLAAAR